MGLSEFAGGVDEVPFRPRLGSGALYFASNQGMLLHLRFEILEREDFHHKIRDFAVRSQFRARSREWTEGTKPFWGAAWLAGF
jgi:hypothetical protein